MPIEIQPDDDGPDPIPVQPGTNEATVLEVLANHPRQAFRQTELADRAGINRTSVYKTVDRLEGKGLVRRHEDGKHYYIDPERRDAIYHRLRAFKRQRSTIGEEAVETDWSEYPERGKEPLPDPEASEGPSPPSDDTVTRQTGEDGADAEESADDWSTYEDREKAESPDREDE